MEKVSYTELNAFIIHRVSQGARFMLTGENGEAIAALVSLDDLELLEDFEHVQDAIDSKAVEEARTDRDLIDWNEHE